MPKVTKQIARADIWSVGIMVDANTKSGKKHDKSKPNMVDGVLSDTLLVSKGQEYYRWSFNFGPTYVSLTYPKRQQLTQSDFLQQAYDIEDALSEFSTENVEEIESFIEEKKEEIQSLLDETQEKLDAMPESLQYSPTGELLQERIDGLENAINELDNIDVNFDEYEPDDDDDEEAQEEKRDEYTQEWVAGKVGEINEISLGV